MATGKKKRAPGAGRPPEGPIKGKSAYINIRCTADTRARLEAERALSRQSLSQIAEQALIDGLDIRADAKRDDPMKGLCVLIAELGWQVSGTFEPHGKTYKPVHDWHAEPFYFEAFRVAVDRLLLAMRPEGEIPTAQTADSEPITPEAVGVDTFKFVWRQYQQAKYEGRPALAADMAIANRRELGMERARNHLRGRKS